MTLDRNIATRFELLERAFRNFHHIWRWRSMHTSAQRGRTVIPEFDAHFGQEPLDMWLEARRTRSDGTEKELDAGEHRDMGSEREAINSCYGPLPDEDCFCDGCPCGSHSHCHQNTDQRLLHEWPTDLAEECYGEEREDNICGDGDACIGVRHPAERSQTYAFCSCDSCVPSGS